jgi:hypothetical protein
MPTKMILACLKLVSKNKKIYSKFSLRVGNMVRSVNLNNPQGCEKFVIASRHVYVYYGQEKVFTEKTELHGVRKVHIFSETFNVKFKYLNQARTPFFN